MLHYYCDENAELSKRSGYTDIPYSILDAEKGWNLNEHKVASKLESVGIPLAKFCQSRHGIATLSNKTYIFTPIDEMISSIIWKRKLIYIRLKRDM